MDDDKKLELINLSAVDFESFEGQFETLNPTEKMEFKNFIEKVQNYLNASEQKKMEDVTGFQSPS